MEPRIQYAKTADGVSIAFWTLGEDSEHDDLMVCVKVTKSFMTAQHDWCWRHTSE